MGDSGPPGAPGPQGDFGSEKFKVKLDKGDTGEKVRVIIMVDNIFCPS